MINRTLIRIRILQVLYSYYQNGSADLKAAENELLFSLRKSYDLYYYFLLLMISLTDLLERTFDSRKHKYMPSDEERNPNMRLVNNRFVRQLRDNEALLAYVGEYKIGWDNDQDFVKGVLDAVLSSDLYAAYLSDPDDSYETDRTFWRSAFKAFVCEDDTVAGFLEDKSIYWNDDVSFIETFTIKTIKYFKEQHGGRQALLPMFADEETRLFAINLFRHSLLHGQEIRGRIGRRMNNWDTDRVASIDLIIMQVAVAEIMFFPSIPISVSMNEYIDIAKHYSTPRSGFFINGILDGIIEELKKENILFKD
ncbi:MAG: transcription antitermination protein NusB [Tannerellaceae bacterium]|jgi:N utilization substance protein B|nr:transcription antitermination protein NusB [Tannerellaceae bacterium]